MAMEMHILSDRQLNSIAEWQAAIDAEGFPLKLQGTSFIPHAGFTPAQLDGKPTGFEFYHDPAEDFVSENFDIDFGHAWKFVLGFRWRGDFNEFQAAWMAAAAYATATNGIVFDGEDGTIRTAAESRDEVREIVRGMPKLKEIMRELDATRPQRVQEFRARWSEKP